MNDEIFKKDIQKSFEDGIKIGIYYTLNHIVKDDKLIRNGVSSIWLEIKEKMQGNRS